MRRVVRGDCLRGSGRGGHSHRVIVALVPSLVAGRHGSGHRPPLRWMVTVEKKKVPFRILLTLSGGNKRRLRKRPHQILELGALTGKVRAF